MVRKNGKEQEEKRIKKEEKSDRERKKERNGEREKETVRNIPSHFQMKRRFPKEGEWEEQLIPKRDKRKPKHWTSTSHSLQSHVWYTFRPLSCYIKMESKTSSNQIVSTPLLIGIWIGKKIGIKHKEQSKTSGWLNPCSLSVSLSLSHSLSLSLSSHSRLIHYYLFIIITIFIISITI